MSTVKALLLLVAIHSFCAHAADEEFVSGSVDVREAVQTEVKRLDPSWLGSVERILPPSGGKIRREVLFTHFIRDASAHSDPDCPRPHLPAIFRAESGKDGTYGVDTPAIYANMHEDWFRSWKTFGDVLDTCPGVIQAFDEEASEESGYWFNSFMVGRGEEEMEVFLITFTGPADRSKRDIRIKDLEVWKGTLKPGRTTASSQPSSADAPGGGSR